MYYLLSVIILIVVGLMVYRSRRRARARSSYNLAMLREIDRSVGFAEWDLSSFTVRPSEHQCWLYGLEPELEYSYQDYLSFVHSDYRVRFDQAIHAAISEQGEFEVEFLVVDRDGEERWLQSTGQVFVDSRRRTAQLLETTRDITEIKALQDANRRQEMKWRTLMTNRVELVLTIDHTWSIAFVNPTSQRVLDYSPRELLGEPILSFVHPQDREWLGESLDQIQQRQVTQSLVRFRLKAKSNDWLWLEASIQDEYKNVGAIVVHASELPQIKQNCRESVRSAQA